MRKKGPPNFKCFILISLYHLVNSVVRGIREKNLQFLCSFVLLMYTIKYRPFYEPERATRNVNVIYATANFNISELLLNNELTGGEKV